MKDFKHWGIKVRRFEDFKYNAIWNDLVTLRTGDPQSLPVEYSEFYDIGINNKCNAECPFCYVGANHEGENFADICTTWIRWMATFKEEYRQGILFTEKPFQIAIGSTGEPTIHPDFCLFLAVVHNTGVVPNYTTNGIVIASDTKLSERILDYTEKYCGGVAVSLSNPKLYNQAVRAINKLINRDIHVMIHHIISDMESVDRFVTATELWGDSIRYHVLLPLMPSGRSTKGLEPLVFEYLEAIISEKNISNVAFGAHFVESLKNSKLKTSLYEPEAFSSNVILTKDKVQITPSSFDLKPVKIVELMNIIDEVTCIEGCPQEEWISEEDRIAFEESLATEDCNEECCCDGSCVDDDEIYNEGPYEE